MQALAILLRTPSPGGSTQRGQALYSFGLHSGSGRCSSASTISSTCPISMKSDIIRKRPRHDARAPHSFLTGSQAPPAPLAHPPSPLPKRKCLPSPRVFLAVPHLLPCRSWHLTT
ncbi:hypothetical protein M405DRAFT_434170 [Rhizopogon salebrosus TDB-379]|nr:hypothetical protein M405DRAFT_434170 [Rhizopogon salebrosus TDB-379]